MTAFFASQEGAPFTQSGTPVGLAPNGTIATNGIVTLGTALPTTYSLGIWLRFPAGAVVGGSAGLYWCVMSSTTQGQVYTNFADPATQFISRVPSGALVAAVGNNSAYTQTTGADVTLANITLPGGLLGLNGMYRKSSKFSVPSNGNNKVLGGKFAGTFVTPNNVITTSSGFGGIGTVRNRGATNRQICSNGVNDTSGAASASTYLSVDTSVNQQITFTGNMAVATDYIILEAFTIEVFPS